MILTFTVTPRTLVEVPATTIAENPIQLVWLLFRSLVSGKYLVYHLPANLLFPNPTRKRKFIGMWRPNIRIGCWMRCSTPPETLMRWFLCRTARKWNGHMKKSPSGISPVILRLVPQSPAMINLLPEGWRLHSQDTVLPLQGLASSRTGMQWQEGKSFNASVAHLMGLFYNQNAFMDTFYGGKPLFCVWTPYIISPTHSMAVYPAMCHMPAGWFWWTYGT